MGVRIVDTFGQIRDYKNRNLSFSLDSWKKYADCISPALYEKCVSDISDYDFERDVLPVLEAALFRYFERIEAAHRSLEDIGEFLEERVEQFFCLNFNLDILFYLGLCNGAGWATTLDGKQVILLGAEKIAELEWQDADVMGDLICHETAHIIHEALRNGISDPERSIWQLYSEGFATRYSQKLYKEGFYHQNRNGWLAFCETHLPLLKKEYLDRLQKGKSTSDFFGDWNSFMGKSDLGYYLGCEFVKFLEDRYSPVEIACLTAEMIEKELYCFLELG